MAVRVVGREQHKPARQARIGRGKQRVCRHVDADMLHGDQGLGPGQGRARADLQRHLFVDRVFEPHAAVVFKAAEGVRHFGGRRAGIARDHADPGLQRAARDSLVAEQQMALPGFL